MAGHRELKEYWADVSVETCSFCGGERVCLDADSVIKDPTTDTPCYSVSICIRCANRIHKRLVIKECEIARAIEGDTGQVDDDELEAEE